MRIVTLFLALLIATFVLLSSSHDGRGEEGEDALTSELIETYFAAHHVKMSHDKTTDLRGLSWYLADRARRSGAWRGLLERAVGGCTKSIHLLGMMLAREARERVRYEEYQRWVETGPHDLPFSARDPELNSDLRDEVVAAFRGQLADPECERHPQQPLLLALVRSRHPDLTEDYLRVLRTPEAPRGALFYAAAGLLRMEEEAGAEWMKDHGRGKGRIRSRPSGAKDWSISEACTVLLENPQATFVEELRWIP